MGQFASRAFDGDPYIEIMRVLPDKELCWWIQKVIWLAEGFTIVDHFGRTYPQLLVHKCEACNGAGTITCPHCQGYKVKRATSHNGFRLSQQTDVGRLLASAGAQDCHHCGDFCAWDAESEWQGNWQEWERKLAYYNRSYGPVMDNWYEDVVNEGNLDEDTQQEEEPAPPPEVKGLFPDLDRQWEKVPKRLKALMKRFGGHPYETFDMLPYQILDPSKPLEENVERMGYDYNWLPPEMDPQGFPEHLLLANGPQKQLEHQIRMEYLLLNNLDAAIKDQPKPALFGPAAGTVQCPACMGAAYRHSLTPNVAKLFAMETPFWLRTLTNMSQLGTLDVSADAYRRRPRPYASSPALQEEERRLAAAPLSSSSSAAGPSGRRFGEVPNQPYKDLQIQAALDSMGARVGQSTPVDQGDFGPLDPLGYESFRGRADADVAAGEVMSRSNPITGTGPAEAAWVYESLNPARDYARKVRDLRMLGLAESAEEKEALAGWLASREDVAADLQAVAELPQGAGPEGGKQAGAARGRKKKGA